MRRQLPLLCVLMVRQAPTTAFGGIGRGGGRLNTGQAGGRLMTAGQVVITSRGEKITRAGPIMIILWYGMSLCLCFFVIPSTPLWVQLLVVVVPLKIRVV